MSGGGDGRFVRDFDRRRGVVQTLDRIPRLPPAQASNLLPLVAAAYEPLWRRRSLRLLSGGAITTERELQLLTAWAAELRDDGLLDVGCSAGLYARTLARMRPDLEVHALDLSQAFLERLAARAEREELSIVPVRGDARALPYRDGAFAALTSGGTLNELRDVSAALTEQARILRPGGRMWQMFLISAPSRVGRAIQAGLRTGGLIFPTEDEVLRAAAAAGLELVTRELWPPVAVASFVRVPRPEEHGSAR